MTETLSTRCIACGLALTPDETHAEPVCRVLCAARDLINNIGGPGLIGWDRLAEAVTALDLREGEVVLADPARASG